ncbi:hypothetical protein [Aureivirga sp. CE67]|uniref:hypothetical protein n=1 Tax=Aureivirga sp. CE67 TaxID=1788983 RepID=UPI0018C8FA48|nr:hypothetical protein [Aureivirga sp. CE67]
MKNGIKLAAILTLGVSTMFAQNALTSEGKQVFLKSDGTWEYVEQPTNGINYRDLNDEEFYVDKKATFLVKSKRNPKYGIYLDPKKWKFEVNDNEDDSTEYILRTKIDGKTVYGTFSADKSNATVDEIFNAVMEEIRTVDEDAKISIEEDRIVNGNKVTFYKVDGDMLDIHFSVFFYIYANGEESFVAEVHTSKNLDDHKTTQKLFKMLNNVVTVK